MIKGKYVAQVEIDFNFERKDNMFSFEKMREGVVGGSLTNALKELILDDAVDDSFCEVNVTQMYADLYEIDDENKE